MPGIILIRGGGDLASGVALRLHRVGLSVVITELEKPLAVRRLVSFAEAVYSGETIIEGVTARRVNDPGDSLKVLQTLSKGRVPVLIDQEAASAHLLHPIVIVDGRMLKQAPEALRHSARLYIGLGPGFLAGDNCHAVIETQRGHLLGRVIWQGAAQPDSGLPEAMGELQAERVLRAPVDGKISPLAQIGDELQAGQPVAEIGGQIVSSPIMGVLRGLLHPDVEIKQGTKIGDIDPRNDPALCNRVSDKSLAVGGGVLEAILTRPEVRSHLWS
jgi:xanthine dehydrogenase accessory factor